MKYIYIIREINAYVKDSSNGHSDFFVKKTNLKNEIFEVCYETKACYFINNPCAPEYKFAIPKDYAVKSSSLRELELLKYLG